MFGGIYADKVYTVRELRSKSADVLDEARNHPVTISRNSEQFALLNRDLASSLVRRAQVSQRAFDLIGQALTVHAGKAPIPGFEWLTAYENDDLFRMVQEVLNEVGKANQNNSGWEMVDAVIHEWYESALVTQSGVLAEAMAERARETPIPAPIVRGTAKEDKRRS